MKLRLSGRLPFVSATLRFANQTLTLDQVLLDTGSAGSVFSADAVDDLGIRPEGSDRVLRILGVGGSEFVYSKQVQMLALGELQVEDFEIQIGAMRYGFPLKGIVGMDFLLATQAIIDLDRQEIRGRTALSVSTPKSAPTSPRAPSPTPPRSP